MNKNKINTLFVKLLDKKPDTIKELYGGMMNQSYLVFCGHKKYIIYFGTKEANKMVNRLEEFKNFKKAESLGLTSKNLYFDTKTGIKINEFIDGNSLNHYKTYSPKKTADLLKKLHTSKLFAESDYKPFNRYENIYEPGALKYTNLDDKDYIKIKKCVFDNKSFLEKREKVICHNDAQKSNIVRSTNGKYYLIDFEFMGNNDPIYDIATFGNDNVEDGIKVLNKYFRNPNKEIITTYYLWRMFISLQWYIVAITKHFQGEGSVHGFDFMNVAKHFLENAKESYNKYNKL